MFLSLKPTVLKLNKYKKIKRQTYMEFQFVMNYRVYTKRCREQAPQPHLLANQALQSITHQTLKNSIEVEPVHFLEYNSKFITNLR